MVNTKPIHLLYVPTMFCNMGCDYCYLGTQTDQKLTKTQKENIISTLVTGLQKITISNHVAFNVSLHGGEVTTMPKDLLEDLFKIINQHYVKNFDVLNSFGIKKNTPHLKTNLFNFNRLYDLFDEHRVTVSASIDLPLSLHEKYRVTKSGNSTLPRTLENLKLLTQYPHKKKVSAVLYNEHLDNTDQIIQDIWFIHREIGFNMNNFNFMFGFESNLNDEKFKNQNKLDTTSVSEQRQVAFYNTIKKEFEGTELEEGFKGNWFDEFKPSYCTSSLNCGEKFYLLQADGEVHSCVRGQGTKEFSYGNILTTPFDHISRNGAHQIQTIHQQQELHADCKKCDYLYLCHTGCAFVKHQKNSGKSYTCLLQKEIYKDNPKSYPPMNNEKNKIHYKNEYIKSLHPNKMGEIETKPDSKFVLPNDLSEEKNELLKIIDADDILASLYRSDLISLNIDNENYTLESPILKKSRTLFYLNDNSKIKLLIHSSLFQKNCKELVRNTLYIQLLRDTTVIYGDEKREKQEHIFTHQLFYNLIPKKGDLLEFDLTPLLSLHSKHYQTNTLNNLFITTNYLRDYHYKKQKSNAFYHIQAINLPFPNIEFYWK